MDISDGCHETCFSHVWPGAKTAVGRKFNFHNAGSDGQASVNILNLQNYATDFGEVCADDDFLAQSGCTQSDNYIMRLRLQNKTGTKDLSTLCILFKVHPFCIDTASGTN